MRRFAIALGLAACTLGGVAGCENPSGPERKLEGKRVYDRHCARCHGVDGKPTAESPGARDLRNLSYMRSLTDDDLRRAIEQGKPPAMPPFGGKFLAPTQKLLMAYVRRLSDPELQESFEPAEPKP